MGYGAMGRLTRSPDTPESGGGSPADEVRKKYREAARATGDYVTVKKDDFVQATREQLDRLKAKAQQVGARAAQGRDAASRKIQEHVDHAEDSLRRARESGADAWEKTRQTTASALRKLGDLLDAAARKVGGQE